MWWGKGSDDKDPKASPPSTAGAEASTDPRYDKSKTNNTTTSPPAAFDPNKLPARQKLSPALQKIVDKQERDDNYFDELYDG